jgi:hypothetical protein
MLKKFFPVCVVAAAVVFFTTAVIDLIDTPTVYRDALSGKCIAIQSTAGVEKCIEGLTVLPDRHDPVYVKPGTMYNDIYASRQR